MRTNSTRRFSLAAVAAGLALAAAGCSQSEPEDIAMPDWLQTPAEGDPATEEPSVAVSTVDPTAPEAASMTPDPAPAAETAPAAPSPIMAVLRPRSPVSRRRPVRFRSTLRRRRADRSSCR